MRQYILIVILVFVVSLSEMNAQTRDSIDIKDKVGCESNLTHFQFAKSVTDSDYMNNCTSLREVNPITIEPIVEQAILSKQVETIKPLFAIKTNLLELAAGAANIGLEVRLGRKLSLYIPLTYSPYTISSDYRIRVMMLRPELRYWFRDAFDGHFVGIHGIGGIYNVSINSDTRYQSNQMAYGVGISYGYTFRFSKHWGMELALGAGYVNTSYDCYYNVPNGMMYDSRNKHYWGITRASLGIIYLINRKR